MRDYTKYKVFKEIIILSFEWESAGVVNIGWLEGTLGMTGYYIKKELKKLQEEGYIIQTVRGGGFCEYSCEPVPPVKGYSLTEKAINTVMYNELEREEVQNIKKVFCLT